jgi:hypothetical protein
VKGEKRFGEERLKIRGKSGCARQYLIDHLQSSTKLTTSGYSQITVAISKYSECNKLIKINEVVSVANEDIVWSA